MPFQSIGYRLKQIVSNPKGDWYAVGSNNFGISSKAKDSRSTRSTANIWADWRTLLLQGKNAKVLSSNFQLPASELLHIHHLPNAPVHRDLFPYIALMSSIYWFYSEYFDRYPSNHGPTDSSRENGPRSGSAKLQIGLPFWGRTCRRSGRTHISKRSSMVTCFIYFYWEESVKSSGSQINAGPIPIFCNQPPTAGVRLLSFALKNFFDVRPAI